MSDIHPSTSQQSMLSVACERCKAKPGNWCLTTSGAGATNLHAPRWYAARDAGLLPWQRDPETPEEHLEAHIRKIVLEAPPLTQEQISKLQVLLQEVLIYQHGEGT